MQFAESATTSSSTWSAATLLKSDDLTPAVQRHLVSVYTLLATSVAAAALGSLAVLRVPALGNLGFLLTLGSLATLVWLKSMPVRRDTLGARVGVLHAFSALTGVAVGPLVRAALHINPALVSTAFLCTVCLFAAFSASALFARRRQYLFLGGVLMSALSNMLLVSFLNVFFGSALINQGLLYTGLIVFSGFVVFDTQLIIEKASNGDTDIVSHALELFLDFVNIFVRVLAILAQNDGRKKNKKDGAARSR